MTKRPKAPPKIVLTEEETQTLRKWRKGTKTQLTSNLTKLERTVLVPRAQIILATARGFNEQKIIKTYHFSLPTIRKWVKRFLDSRLAGLLENRKPRSGKTVSEDIFSSVISRFLQNDKNTTRQIAAIVGISQATVARIIRRYCQNSKKPQQAVLETTH